MGTLARTAVRLLRVAPPLVVLLVGLSFRNSSALPDPSAVTLQWTAPDVCPDAPYVKAQILRLLGGATTDDDTRVTASAKVTRRPDGSFRLVLITSTSKTKGSRTLDDQSCEQLADATALILAMTVNPTKVAQTAASASAVTSASTVATASAPSASSVASASVVPGVSAPPPPPPFPSASLSTAIERSPPPRSRESSSTRVRAIAATSGLVDLGATPGVALGLGVALGVDFGRLRAEVEGDYLAPHDHSLADRPTAGGKFRMISIGARLGWFLVDGDVALAPLLGIDHAFVHAEGFGVASPDAGTAELTRATFGVMGALRLAARFAVRLVVEGGAPFTRPTFVLDGVGDVYHQPAVTARASLGLELRL